ncbi:MAG: phenylalanine--tRNA ligase subunit alpha [Bacteroidota bacterium]
MSAELFEQALKVQTEIEQAQPENAEALEQFRIKYIGAKGIATKGLMGEIRNIENTRKKEYGQLVNAIKQAAIAKHEALKAQFEAAKETAAEQIDRTAPAEPLALGSRHPIAITLNEIVDIFGRIGFTIAEDREIEDDWHNFTAMNTPEDHPARDMQDTFYLMNSTERLLRTHTSSVQARTMTSQQPPIRIIAPGRVYRNETISARSHCQFHQVEGLYVDEGVSFADMKQTLYYFAKEMYGATRIRLRPSYFPFTEPSAEMDVYWGLNDEIDYRITKGTGWLEILGCGMVDPNVLENCGIDSTKYSGFAFGMGIERQAMLKYRISDIRLLFENDVRFLKQFTAAK